MSPSDHARAESDAVASGAPGAPGQPVRTAVGRAPDGPSSSAQRAPPTTTPMNAPHTAATRNTERMAMRHRSRFSPAGAIVAALAVLVGMLLYGCGNEAEP